MADFPTDLTNAIDNTTDVLAKHINNIEAKIGVDSSTVTTSLDYRVATLESSGDGWIEDSDTWTYASTNTFTVSGDVTDVFTPGARVKFTQSGTVKYGTVAESAYVDPTTTVTLIQNDDYTVANAVISDNYYSYAACPPGYPVIFDITTYTTWSGFSADPAINLGFSVIGSIFTIHFTGSASGTSNSTDFSFTIPVKTAQTYDNLGVVYVKDNGANLADPGHLKISSTGDANIVDVEKSFYGGAFTASGSKTVYFSTVTLEFNGSA